MSNAVPRTVMVSSVVSAVSSVVVQSGGDTARITKDVTDMCNAYPTLFPEVDTMVHDNGFSQTLAKVRGTLPIVFRGNQYNIPVVMWIPARYPNECPKCFVAPTKDMIIRRNHSNVDRSGNIFLPYLKDWSPYRSRLVELCTVMASVFSSAPPLNAKPHGYDEQQEYERSVNRALAQSLSYTNTGLKTTARAMDPSSATSSFSSYGSKSASASKVADTATRSQSPPSYSAAQASGSSSGYSSTFERAEDKAKTSDNSYLQDAINQKVDAKCDQIREKIKTAGERSDMLRDGEDKIRRGVEQLQNEKKALEECIGMIEQRDNQLAAWIEEQEKLANDIEKEKDPDAILKPADGLNNQLFDQVATIAAVDDILFHLDSALQEGIIEIGPYLKTVRNLATKQFMAKALAIKINDLQASALAGSGKTSGNPPPSYRK